MIKEIHITKFEQVWELIGEQVLDEKSQRNRSSYLYRGMCNSGYSLKTSLARNCKEKATELESSIIRNFNKYATLQNPHLSESIWNKLIIGQHHGLPTRLLDWTWSPLIGLHFATSGEDISRMDEHDAVVWKINVEEVNALLPGRYVKVLSSENAYLFTVDMLDSIVDTLDKFDDDMQDDAILFIEPPSIDERVINQFSYFSIIPNKIIDIESFFDKCKFATKYVISKELKWQIRDMLDQMNINERITYPGLDGLSQWLKRYYYVK